MSRVTFRSHQGRHCKPHPHLSRSRRAACALPGVAWLRPLLPSLLACALLAGGLSLSRADEAPKPDKETGSQGDKEKGKEEKEEKGKGESNPTPNAQHPTPNTPIKVASAQDAPEKAAPQNNPPTTNTPPTKPSEGQPAQTPAAPAPAPTPPGTVTYSGLIDVYFGINGRAPRGVAPNPFAPAFTGAFTPSGEKIRIDNAGRAFDINDRDPSFSLGEFNINRTEGKGFPVGVTATLTVGDTARLAHANEPGGTSSWQTLQQLYVTKSAHLLSRDVTFDAGIFVTPLGYEVIESASNDNYSRSFGFQYAIPLYHAGGRVTIPLTPKLQLVGALVNGWNNIADDGDGKSGIAQLTWKPAANFTGIFGFMGGTEGTGAYGPILAPKNQAGINTYVYEVQPIYQVNAKLKIAGDLIYGNASGHTLLAGAGGAAAQGHVSGDWVALAAYARYQATPRLAIAGRLEQFEDLPGAGGFGLRLGIPGYAKLSSTTLTLEYALLRGHIISRLEYRHDHSSAAFFGQSANAVKEQDTFYGSAAYKF